MSTKRDLSNTEWQGIKEEIRTLLIGLAKIRRTISYSELAAQIRVAYVHYRAPAFDRILQDLCADEVAASRPILGVVVVNKQTGYCGAGFFKWAAMMGYNVSDPELFWHEEFERVCNYWADMETE